MTVYFTSDLHLDATTKRLVAGFATFLDQRVDKGDELYILGDLCEVWVGDDDDSPFCGTLARMLTDVSRRAHVAFIHGNRDFLLGDRFARRTGIHLLPDLTVIERHGLRMLLSHGDAWCTRDLAYQEARRLLRSPAWQADVLARSLPERRELARALREQSRATNANKADNIMDVTESEVCNAAVSRGADTVIHGHTHRPGIHLIRSRKATVRRYVLGDWGRCGNAIALSDEGIRLERFALPSPASRR